MSLENARPPLSEAQLEIMNVIWDQEPCTVADVWKILNERRGVARNTVQTLMARLDEKGWVTHEETPNGFLYRAATPREDVQEQLVLKMVETLFNGSAENLVLTLMNQQNLTADEIQRIQQRIAASRKGNK